MRSPSRSRITFSEANGIRYLHFGTEWIQGAMRLSRPDELVLEYVHQMMAWLLFLDPPEHVVQLGLGAGALTRFVHRRMPGAAVTAVEIDPAVIAACHAMFALPRPDDRLELICGDAARHACDPANAGRAGVLQVDLYDAQARGPACSSEEFYAGCRALLREPGVMTVNLFGTEASFPVNERRLRAAFEGRVLRLPEVDAGNRILLAFAGPPIETDFARLFDRAADIEQRYRLPARKWVKGLRAANPSPGGRLVV